MKEIQLDIKKVVRNENNSIASGILISKAKEIGSFSFENGKFTFLMNPKSPYSSDDLIDFSNQIKYGHNGSIELLIKYLNCLNYLKKVISTNLKKGWKHFYFCSGTLNDKPFYFKFGSKIDDKLEIKKVYDNILLEHNIKPKCVKRLDSVEELEPLKIFKYEKKEEEIPNLFTI